MKLTQEMIDIVDELCVMETSVEVKVGLIKLTKDSVLFLQG